MKVPNFESFAVKICKPSLQTASASWVLCSLDLTGEFQPVVKVNRNAPERPSGAPKNLKSVPLPPKYQNFHRNA